MVVDSAEGREKCTRRHVRIAKKSVKFLLNPAEIARFTAKNASQSVRIRADRKELFR